MKKLMKMVLSAWCLVLGAEAARAAEQLPDGYTAVEYIESTKGGGQFIDTDYTANGQTKVVFDAVIPARWEQNDRFGVLFGSRTMTDWTGSQECQALTIHRAAPQPAVLHKHLPEADDGRWTHRNDNPRASQFIATGLPPDGEGLRGSRLTVSFPTISFVTDPPAFQRHAIGRTA